eukprot:CAMPEP_0114671042 /NCGR_PEP_ID=MMETSP0191-20121206/40484_1 /TAXON_ID=126664 /ORGANISM="Sorites sp." /LENGTH=142 /DNA_ID=CAMNT_0001929933 /DNA_START=891 /DNA_END=1316 /DNA_ORIENTATION=+
MNIIRDVELDKELEMLNILSEWDENIGTDSSLCMISESEEKDQPQHNESLHLSENDMFKIFVEYGPDIIKHIKGMLYGCKDIPTDNEIAYILNKDVKPEVLVHKIFGNDWRTLLDTNDANIQDKTIMDSSLSRQNSDEEYKW